MEGRREEQKNRKMGGRGRRGILERNEERIRKKSKRRKEEESRERKGIDQKRRV